MRLWLIRLLIWLYPAEFRARYGRELLAFHRDRARAGLSLAAWLVIIADHLKSAAAAHVSALGRAGSGRRHGMAVSMVVQDVRYALRALSRRPSFAAVVLVTIALGVGANTAIFSMVNGIMLRPLPYPHAERVVSFGHESPIWLASDPEYLDYRRGLRSFEALAAFTQGESNLATEEEPERVGLATVTPDFFTVLGTAPQIGRSFVAEDDLSPPARVAIISHSLWQRRFASDPALVGRTISFGGRPRTVVGIMPPNFDYPSSRVEVWLPLARLGGDGPAYDRSNHYLFMVGRLRPNVTVEAARIEARSFAQRMVREHAHAYDPKYPSIPVLEQVNENLVAATRPYLWALLGAVGFVLLIVCANVANLLLARGEGRRKELAVRTALGASRARLLTQLLSESLVLALLGGALGLGLAWAANRALHAVAPASIPRLDEIGIDAAVLGYSLITSLVAGLLFGLGPAFRAAQKAPAESLQKGGRSAYHGGTKRVRRSLVVAEVALAVITLSGAGLLLRSLVNLQRADLGFDSRSALTLEVSPHPTTYDDARSIAFYAQLLERVRALPGVQHAGAAGWLPVVAAGGLWGVLAEGQSYATLAQGPSAVPQQVTPGYLSALGIPLVAGRDFSDHDRESGPYVAIVSRSLAHLLWPDANPLGKRFRLGGAQTYMTVVGVVGDIRAGGFTDTPQPTMYFPYAQTARAAYFMPRSMSLVLRTQGDPARVARQVRAIVRSLDATVPVSDVQTLEQVVGTSVASRRFSTVLIAAFATLALVLAGIGIFGVVSYGVSERTFEIGVRMALGAGRGRALALVAADSFRMTAVGIGIGLLGAVLVARALRSMLVDVAIIDMPTMIAVAAVLILVVGMATVLPALRAMAVNPTDVLRSG
jgi:putative ABC transport system permease protein